MTLIRYVVSNKTLEGGKVILKEAAYATAIFDSMRSLVCDHCLITSSSPFKFLCDKCKKTSYCSQKCKLNSKSYPFSFFSFSLSIIILVCCCNLLFIFFLTFHFFFVIFGMSRVFVIVDIFSFCLFRVHFYYYSINFDITLYITNMNVQL